MAQSGHQPSDSDKADRCLAEDLCFVYHPCFARRLGGVSGGKETQGKALTAIAKQRPDLILMDIQLPIMDGYTAVRRIKADPGLRSIPIIAVTSYALDGS
jgi:hypothetical protein